MVGSTVRVCFQTFFLRNDRRHPDSPGERRESCPFLEGHQCCADRRSRAGAAGDVISNSKPTSGTHFPARCPRCDRPSSGSGSGVRCRWLHSMACAPAYLQVPSRVAKTLQNAASRFMHDCTSDLKDFRFSVQAMQPFRSTFMVWPTDVLLC